MRRILERDPNNWPNLGSISNRKDNEMTIKRRTEMNWTDEMIDELVCYLESLEEEGLMPSEIEEARHAYVRNVEEEYETWESE